MTLHALLLAGRILPARSRASTREYVVADADVPASDAVVVVAAVEVSRGWEALFSPMISIEMFWGPDRNDGSVS